MSNTERNNTEAENKSLKPADKYCLTIEEASKYFTINTKKLRELAKDHADDGFVIMHGIKVLIIRPAFEKFLDEVGII